MGEFKGVEITRHTLHYRAPITTAHGQLHQRPVVVVAVSDDQGNIGFGEAAPLTGFTAENINESEAAIRQWFADEQPEGPPNLPTARAAIDGAFLDLQARQRGLALHRHLNPESPDRLPLAALLAGRSTEDLVCQALERKAEGFTTLKIKVAAASFSVDFERVAAVRSATGKDMALRLDANGGWTTTEALHNIEKLAPLGIEFIEEPTAGLEALAAVCREAIVPVAVDESAGCLSDLRRAIDLGAGDFFVVKPSSLGGLVVAGEAVTLATTAGQKVIITSLLESSYGIRLAAHFAAAHGLTNPAPGLATAELLTHDPGSPLTISDGHLLLT